MITRNNQSNNTEAYCIPDDKAKEKMLKYVIIDISKYNEPDSLEAFRANTSFIVLPEFNPMLCTNELFVITDNRKTADAAVLNGIGFAAYLSEDKISDDKIINDFPDSLYLITSLSELTDTNIIRMHQRAAGIPWKILETDRAIVREITISDIDALYSIYSDDETVRYIEKLYENKEDEISFTKNYIENQYKYFEYGLWAVLSKPDNKLIGRAGIFMREGFQDVELGFVFDRSVWGISLSYEVCKAIVEYSNEEFGFERFNAFTKPLNLRGKHLLERLGFKYYKSQELNGEEFDMYSLSL